MSLSSLLPLRGLVITLRCTATARLAFFHQPALTAFLRFLAGSPDQYDQLIRIDAPESGRINYREGEHYRFLLLGLAGSEALLDALLAGLAGLPRSAPKQGEGLPFADNWRLEAVQDMFTGNPITCLAEACCYDAMPCKRKWRCGKASSRCNGSGSPLPYCSRISSSVRRMASKPRARRVMCAMRPT